MVSRFLRLVAVVALTLTAACSSTLGPDVTDDEVGFDPGTTSIPPGDGASDGGPEPGDGGTPTPPVVETPRRSTPTPTPTPRPTPPPNVDPIVVAPVVRATVGGEATATISANDPDGEIADLTWSELPDGASASGPVLTWRPETAGTWRATVTAVDDRGARVTRRATLLARHESRPHAIVAMGDSVASGHGLQVSDYLGADGCWRDAGEAYPRQVMDSLVASGLFDADLAELALVACSGHDPDDLFETPVTGGLEGTAPDGVTEMTQLDWAVRANARIVTMTIGANDTGFVGPEKLLLPDNTLDRDDVARRMRIIRTDLTTVLDRLVGETDSLVVVTTYYDPTAIDPQGVEGCRGACFAEKAAEVVTELNRTIAEVAGGYGDRVIVVDLRELFEDHGAPNGLGPDGLREGGFGPLGELIGGLVSDVHPYCARGEALDDPWINAVDCVHPDARGTSEIAAAVTAAIVEHLAGPPRADG